MRRQNVEGVHVGIAWFICEPCALWWIWHGHWYEPYFVYLLFGLHSIDD